MDGMSPPGALANTLALLAWPLLAQPLLAQQKRLNCLPYRQIKVVLKRTLGFKPASPCMQHLEPWDESQGLNKPQVLPINQG